MHSRVVTAPFSESGGPFVSGGLAPLSHVPPYADQKPRTPGTQSVAEPFYRQGPRSWRGYNVRRSNLDRKEGAWILRMTGSL
jgi:hypothetical protein